MKLPKKFGKTKAKLGTHKTMFALFCNSSRPPLLCGIFVTKEDAERFNDGQDLSICEAKHVIKKVEVIIK